MFCLRLADPTLFSRQLQKGSIHIGVWISLEARRSQTYIRSEWLMMFCGERTGTSSRQRIIKCVARNALRR